MAITIHGPGVHDPYPLERLRPERGPAAIQPAAVIRPLQEEGAAALRLQAAIRATQEGSGTRIRARRAAELMDAGAHVLMASMPLPKAREALHRWGVEQAMVVDDEGALIGLLETRDVLQAIWPAGQSPCTVEALQRLSVGDVCRTPVAAVGEDTAFEIVAHLMLDQDYAAVPVVDDANRPLGLIRGADLLRAILDEVHLDAWA